MNRVPMQESECGRVIAAEGIVEDDGHDPLFSLAAIQVHISRPVQSK